MRLKSFTLHRYGNHAAERIGFDTRPGVVNVLLAPNGYGKSVLRGAVTDLLFGIPNQTPMGFRFGYSGMRVSAEMLQSDGSTFAFSRRKARGNTISDEAGQPLDAAPLHGILGGRDRTLLGRLFVLDTEALRAGGNALLASGGDVASALLSAAGGVREARALKQRLEKQRDELAPIRKTAARPFYVALERFAEARRGGTASLVRPEERFRQQSELESLQERQRESNAIAEAASAEISRLERTRRVRPALAKYAEAEQWLLDNAEAPRLAADLAQRLSAARVEEIARQDAVERTRAALIAVEQETGDIVVDANLIARAEQIEQLIGEAGAARKARDDLPTVRGKYDQCLSRTSDLLRDLGSPLPPEQAVQVVPKTALLARMRGLIAAHNDISRAMQSADSQIEGRLLDLANNETLLGDLPPAPDAGALESLLEVVRSDGDPGKRRAEAEKTSRDALTALNAACSAVPGWTGDTAGLIAIAPLTTELYARHAKDVADARRDVEAARQRHDDEEERLAQARATLEAISLGGAVPDEAALARARDRRDRLWRLIARRLFADDSSTDPEETEEPTSSLPLSFERSIIESDHIADRRFAESELVARLAAAQKAVKEAERRAEDTDGRQRIAEQKLQQTRRVWNQVCAPLSPGSEPTLSEIQALITARERVLDASRRADLARHAVDTLLERHTGWGGALAERIGHDIADLPVLLALADRILLRARQRREDRVKLEATKTRCEEQLRAARAARAVQNEKLDVWRGQWRAAMIELARPEDEDPPVTEAVLATLRDIADVNRETNSLSERISGMQADIDRFTRSVAELAQALRPRLLPEDPFEAVRDLGQALNKERALDQRHRLAAKALISAQANAAEAELGQVAARTKLRSILSLIGVDTFEAAAPRLALSADRARFDEQVRTATAELHAFGDGFAIGALREEAGHLPADEITARIDAAAVRRKEASEAAQSIAEGASALRQRLDREAADMNVNTAAANQQAAIASLSRTIDEALVYHTASLMLGRALEVIEKSGDSEMLRRLGRTFQSLTDGAYAGVVTEQDDDGAAHLALLQRDFPEERQSVEQLSEGTRDQFFLALRVAAIEDHVATARPLPFIGDDILQTFDDDRALAALRVLIDLSRQTQVIILTHHRHVLELAARLPEGSVFQCRREPIAMTA